MNYSHPILFFSKYNEKLVKKNRKKTFKVCFQTQFFFKKSRWRNIVFKQEISIYLF